MRHLKLALMLSVASSIGSISVAQAQTSAAAPAAADADSQTVSDVVVTARKREERLVEVPASETVVTATTLNALQYRTIGDILSLSPGVTLDAAAKGINADINIRGVGVLDNFIEPANAVYIDEVYSSGTRTFLPAFYDLESVQILKGPQAGLYGRNTTGGAILITTAQPTMKQSFRAEANYSRYDRLDVNSTLNLPLSEVFQLRATGWYVDNKGGFYHNNILNMNPDASSDKGGRLSLAIVPNARVRLVVSGEHSSQFFTGFQGYVDGGRFGPTAANVESRTNVLHDNDAGFNADVDRLQAKLDIDTGHGDVVVVGGHRRLVVKEPGSDNDLTALEPSLAAYNANPRAYLTQAPTSTAGLNALFRTDQVSMRREGVDGNYVEAHYSTPSSWEKVKLLGGATYYDEHTTYNQTVAPTGDLTTIFSAIDAAGLYPPRPLSGAFTRAVTQDTTSYAVFGEAIIKPIPKIEITAEARYTDDKKHFVYTQLATGFVGLGRANILNNTTRTFNNFSPGITVAYRPTVDTNLYAKYARGFRAGGFNTLVNDPAKIPYDPEKAESFEVGLKQRLFAGRFSYGIDVFDEKIDNTIIYSLDRAPNAADQYPLENSGHSETYGFEADATAVILDGLTLTASLGAFHNKLSQDPALGGSGAYTGKELPFVPTLTASLVATYHRRITTNAELLSSFGYRHRDGGVYLFNAIPYPTYNIADVDVGVRLNGNLEVHVFAKNLFNDRYQTSNLPLSAAQALGQRLYGGNVSAAAILTDPGLIYGVRTSVQF